MTADTATRNRLLQTYLHRTEAEGVDPAAAAYYAALDCIGAAAPAVAAAILSELEDQRSNLKLIASENFSSLTTQLAQGNLFTDKYAEGYIGHRFYAGCANVDAVEAEAAGLARDLFGAEHAYVQPHSGADANLVAFLAILRTTVEDPMLERFDARNPATVTREQWEEVRAALHGQRLLGLDYYSGGHLTHGYRFNVSSRMFDVHSYTVDRETKLIDLDALREQLHEVRPRILLAGYSAYPRKIDFAKMRELADEVGAVFMVDMAHFAGLVAGKAFSGDFDPVPFAHVVTATTHKTLRGPRGGLVLCKKEFADAVDKGCPAVLGGPLPHVMAAKAVAFREASQPEFRTYARAVVDNARALASGLMEEGLEVLTGGTDNHMVLVDVTASFGLTGRHAESALRSTSITLNRNALPFDENGPWYTSGLRLGTAAATTLGMGPREMREIARIVKLVLSNTKPSVVTDDEGNTKTSLAKFDLDAAVARDARSAVAELTSAFPLYPELDAGILQMALDASPAP